MVKAKLTAKQAEMNPLPHINITSALGIESLSLLRAFQEAITEEKTSSQEAQQSINLYPMQFQNGQTFDRESFATIPGQKTDGDVTGETP